MIELMPHTEADRRGVDAREVQCISPYLNPAHILAPPRPWLEALVQGEYSWHFFRLRYKNLLRARYQAEPERFAELLRDSEGPRRLVLTCHCLTTHCHREVAREFLERLREHRSDPAARLPANGAGAWPPLTQPDGSRTVAGRPRVTLPPYAAQILTGPDLAPPVFSRARPTPPGFERAANG